MAHNNKETKGMPEVTILDLPEATYRALARRAFRHGRSLEAEILEILEEAVCAGSRVKIGAELAVFGRSIGGLDFENPRDRTPVEPADFD